MDKHSLTLCSFNCRSIKNSRSEVFRLCECSDFLFLQEHWLLPDELDVLNNIHSDFYGVGYSAVELDNDIILGRPFGGTCILYRKCLAQCVSTLVTHDPRITAVTFDSNRGLVLMICVYMPTDYGSYDSYEQYADTCAKVVAMYEDSDAVDVVLCGDFNCQPGSRFYSLYTQLISDLHLIESDVKRLPSVSFTYCNDSGTATSWIDHFLCCNRIDNLIEKVDIHLSFVTSDHKPLQLTLRNIGAPDTATQTPVNLNGNDNAVLFMTDWSNCVDADFNRYNDALDTELRRINIPKELLALQNVQELHGASPVGYIQCLLDD